MIDIHTHIFPAFDDGAADYEESAAMLKLAYRRGTREVVLTPHFTARQIKNGITVSKLFEMQRNFAEKVFEEVPGIKLHNGAEVYCNSELLELAKEVKLPTVNGGKYLLVEFSCEASFDFMIFSLEKIREFGYCPIIAHLDRYDCLASDFHRTEYLKEAGALIQVNADSIIGRDGMSHSALTLRLLKSRMIDVVASDSHGINYRTPDLSEAAAELMLRTSEKYENKVLSEIPKMIIDNIKIRET